MKKTSLKIILWGIGLSAYALLFAVFLQLVVGLDVVPFLSQPDNSFASSALQKHVKSLLRVEDQSDDFSGILLPVGPDEAQLPGSLVIWDKFLSAESVDKARESADQFDGLQVVKSIADLSHGAIFELFLADTPLKAFRRGRTLLLLQAQGTVLLVDCDDPSLPKMSGSLPYRNIKQMAMRGDLAYLLIENADLAYAKMVIVNLGNPYQPRELAQLRLPKEAASFFFADRQLVVYTNTGGPSGGHFIHLYDLTDDFQLVFIGSAESPSLSNGFLQNKDYLYLPGLRSGLQVFDFGQPLQPVAAGSLVFPDLVRELGRQGDRLFAFGNQGRMYVADLHDPLQPVLVETIEDANHLAYFMEYDHYTYFFTKNGYLRVFDVPPDEALCQGNVRSSPFEGELVALQAGTGFTLLGDHQGPLPAAVGEVFPLPGEMTVVATTEWRDFFVVLDNTGLVQFFRKGKNVALELQESLQLPVVQRWLAAGTDRIYVGGGSVVSIVAQEADGHPVLSGQVELPVADTWDGLVVEQTLAVAAGRAGLLSFSLQDPDHPVASPAWVIPDHLGSLADVRQLAVIPADNRVLIAAGPAGLLGGRVGADGQFQLSSLFAFSSPVYTIALVNGLCLVSAGDEVKVIDVRRGESLQNLGRIAFYGVEKIAVASPDFWAGYVPGSGWSVLPAPTVVSAEESTLARLSDRQESSEAVLYRYRLNLFNNHEVLTTPGVRHLSSLPDGSATGGNSDAR